MKSNSSQLSYYFLTCPVRVKDVEQMNLNSTMKNYFLDLSNPSLTKEHPLLGCENCLDRQNRHLIHIVSHHNPMLQVSSSDNQDSVNESQHRTKINKRHTISKKSKTSGFLLILSILQFHIFY